MLPYCISFFVHVPFSSQFILSPTFALGAVTFISSPFPPFAIVQPLSSVVVRLLDHPVCCRPLGPRFSHDSNMDHTNVTEGVRRLC